MADAFKQVFEIPQGQITSVVLDRSDFDVIVDSLLGVFTQDARADESVLKSLKDAGHLPMMGRGSKTQFVFDRFGIGTDLACFVVRGTGRDVLRSLV